MATDPDAPAPADAGGLAALAVPAVDADGGAAAASPAGSSASASAAVVLDKLAALEVARRAERDRRREEARATADPRESVAAFLAAFAARQRAVEDALQRMLTQPRGGDAAPATTAAGKAPAQPAAAAAVAAAAAASPTPPVPASQIPEPGAALATPAAAAPPPPLAVSAATPEAVAASLELLSGEVVALERSAAAASYYLPSYDQRQCAATVAALRAGIEGARATLAPRKRFAFGSKKVSKVRGEEVSAAAATTPAAPATTASAPSAAAPGPSAAPHTATADAPASSAAAANEDLDLDAPAQLSVSEQDRALVARGRGLLGLTDQTVVLRAADMEDGAGSAGGGGGDFVLLGLTRCTVVLLGRLRALRCAGLRGCTVTAGPVTGATFVDDVRGCSLRLATYQVRVHRTHATDLYLRVRSKPIIEHSTRVRVAPWAAAVAEDDRLQRLMQEHKLGDETGCWQQVDDFGWIKAVQSPNWCVLPDADRPSPSDRMRVPARVWEAEPSAAAAAAGRAAAEALDDDEI